MPQASPAFTLDQRSMQPFYQKKRGEVDRRDPRRDRADLVRKRSKTAGKHYPEIVLVVPSLEFRKVGLCQSYTAKVSINPRPYRRPKEHANAITEYPAQNRRYRTKQSEPQPLLRRADRKPNQQHVRRNREETRFGKTQPKERPLPTRR